MGFYIMLCTVHTTQGQRRERWVSILCYVLYTLHRDRDQGTMGSKPISPPGLLPGNRFLLYLVPFSVRQCEQYTPFPVPVPCSVTEPSELSTYNLRGQVLPGNMFPLWVHWSCRRNYKTMRTTKSCGIIWTKMDIVLLWNVSRPDSHKIRGISHRSTCKY